MSEKEDRAERASERRIQAMIDRAHFHDLYDMAAEIYLKKPPTGVERREYTLQERVVAACGIQGLSLALDGKRRKQHFTEAKDDDDNPGFFFMSTDAILRYPQAFGASVDPIIQQKIENIGEALLDEAFWVLGTDAKPMVARFAAATTADEQKEILDWLVERCIDIGNADMGNFNENEKYVYHPSRLSPKLVGQFPHNTLTPTCLGFSIITASFLYRAGAIQLQAGVADMHQDILRKQYYYAASQTFHDPRTESLTSVKDAAADAYEWGVYKYTNTGVHATTLVKLLDDSWYCVDPNYGLGYVFDENDSGKISQAHIDLEDISHFAKGIEVPVALSHRSTAMTIYEALDVVRNHEIDITDIREIIQDEDTESLVFRVYEEIAKQFEDLYETTEDSAFKSIFTVMKSVDTEYIGEHVDTEGYWLEFVAAWDRHVLHGMDASQLVARCQNDEQFLIRRLEEIQLLPTLALQGLLAREIDLFKAGRSGDEPKHEGIEVGLSAYRIGCAVLSDLALYTDAPLSPQFFLSYWPSRIPITETLGAESRDRAQVLGNNLNWLGHTDFFILNNMA